MDQFFFEVGQAFCLRWERLQFWIRRPASDVDVEVGSQVLSGVPQEDPIRFAAQCWAEQDGQVLSGVPNRDQVLSGVPGAEVLSGVPEAQISFAEAQNLVVDEVEM